VPSERNHLGEASNLMQTLSFKMKPIEIVSNHFCIDLLFSTYHSQWNKDLALLTSIGFGELFLAIFSRLDGIIRDKPKIEKITVEHFQKKPNFCSADFYQHGLGASALGASACLLFTLLPGNSPSSQILVRPTGTSAPATRATMIADTMKNWTK